MLLFWGFQLKHRTISLLVCQNVGLLEQSHSCSIIITCCLRYLYPFFDLWRQWYTSSFRLATCIIVFFSNVDMRIYKMQHQKFSLLHFTQRSLSLLCSMSGMARYNSHATGYIASFHISAVFSNEDGRTCVTDLKPITIEFKDVFQPLPRSLLEKVIHIQDTCFYVENGTFLLLYRVLLMYCFLNCGSVFL